MKRTIRLLILLSIGMVTGNTVNGQETTQTAEEFKPSGKPIILIYANVNNRFSDGENVTSFEINRGFFGYDYSFSKAFSARVIYEGAALTTGGKMYLDGYLRNAYLQYNKGAFTIQGGLFGPEQLVVWTKQWNYRYILRPFFEYTGMIYAGDMGLAAKYKPSETVAFDIAVLNGRGLKDLAPDSTFRYTAGITVFPAKDFIFRGYFDFMSKDNVTQWTMSISGAYTGKTFTLGGEYYAQNNHLYVSGQDYAGFNAFTVINISPLVAFYGIFDHGFSSTLEGETENWNIAKDANTVHLGIEFKPVKGVRLSPNFRYTMPSSDTPNSGFIGLNIEAKL